MPNILTSKELWRKAEPLLLPAIVALVGLSAFGLGRLSAGAGEQPRLVINAPLAPAVSQTASAARSGGERAPSAGSGAYVASKSGSRYYLTTCAGAGRIKEENKVYFSSAVEAKAAGYEPAANCPGL